MVPHREHDTAGLNTFNLTVTGDPDDWLNNIVTACATGECLQLLLRQVVAHKARRIASVAASRPRKIGDD